MITITMTGEKRRQFAEALESAIGQLLGSSATYDVSVTTRYDFPPIKGKLVEFDTKNNLGVDWIEDGNHGTARIPLADVTSISIL